MKPMHVLIGCEFSGIITAEFRARGHLAWSCDLQTGEGEPDWHYRGDVRTALRAKPWDLFICHPPCTDLTSARNGHPINARARAEAMIFFLDMLEADVPKICIENPWGVMNRVIRPSQTIHPWMFGHEFNKRTGLWLKGLPHLRPTKMIPKEYRWDFVGGHSKTNRNNNRSRTFKGIAKAMAEQWG